MSEVEAARLAALGAERRALELQIVRDRRELHALVQALMRPHAAARWWDRGLFRVALGAALWTAAAFAGGGILYAVMTVGRSLAR